MLWILVILGCTGLAQAQPQWVDVTPLPGVEVSWVPKIIWDHQGLWACACSIPNGSCASYDHSLRPYYSGDGGDSWELRDSGIPASASVYAVAINPANPDILLCYNYNPPFGNPHRSTDRGLSWVESADGIVQDDMAFWSRVGWFPDGVHAYCFTGREEAGERYYISADTGRSWQYIRHGAPYYSLITTPLLPGFILYTQELGIRRSFDYGYTWEFIHGDDWVFSELFSSTGEALDTIYATGMLWRGLSAPVVRYFVFTTDTGRTFQMLNPDDTLRWTEYAWGSGLKDPLRWGHLFYLRSDTLFESWDNGRTWEFLWDAPDFINDFHLMGYNAETDRIYVVDWDEPVVFDTSGLWRFDRYARTDSRRPDRTGAAISLYPNPLTAGNRLTLYLPGEVPRAAVLYNLLGQEVFRQQFSRTATDGAGTDFFLPRQIPSGIYFIDVRTQTKSLVHKIVIHR